VQPSRLQAALLGPCSVRHVGHGELGPGQFSRFQARLLGSCVTVRAVSLARCSPAPPGSPAGAFR
jgi:hypothetical protein